MRNYNIEEYSKAVERCAFEKGLLSHFKEDASSIELTI